MIEIKTHILIRLHCTDINADQLSLLLHYYYHYLFRFPEYSGRRGSQDGLQFITMKFHAAFG